MSNRRPRTPTGIPRTRSGDRVRIRPSQILRNFALAVAVSASSGCNKNDADEAKRQAQATSEQAASAAREAEVRAAAAAKDAELKTAQANADAKSKAQKEVDAADRKATYLREKAAKVTGIKKKNSDAAVAELDRRRDAVRTDMSKLDSVTASGWESVKGQVDGDVAALNKAVDNLESALK